MQTTRLFGVRLWLSMLTDVLSLKSSFYLVTQAIIETDHGMPKYFRTQAVIRKLM